MVKAIRLVCRAISFRSPYLVASARQSPAYRAYRSRRRRAEPEHRGAVGGRRGCPEHIVQTDEHVSTLEIPSDGDLSQSAQLDVLTLGDAEGNPGIDFEFNIFPGQTPQSIADQLRNEIVSRLGEAAQETVDVRIETGNPLGLSGELVQVTIPGGTLKALKALKALLVPSIQSIQIIALQGSNVNTVELSVGAEIDCPEQHRSDGRGRGDGSRFVGCWRSPQFAQLDVSIPIFLWHPVDAEVNSGIKAYKAFGQTPQNVDLSTNQ